MIIKCLKLIENNTAMMDNKDIDKHHSQILERNLKKRSTNADDIRRSGKMTRFLLQ
jgi:hypothetical protein